MNKAGLHSDILKSDKILKKESEIKMKEICKRF